MKNLPCFLYLDGERMIAYNHYIKFIPKLKNDKKVEDSFIDVVTVKDSSVKSLSKTLSFEMIFPSSQGRDLSLYTDREFESTQKEQIWAFEVKGVVTFFWHSGTLVLDYIKHDNFTEYLLKYWVLHVVLPVFFIIEGIYDFLHAGAVEVEGEPVLFIAPSMGGKSTMTDYFMKQGHTMISDDKVATFQKDGHFYAVPSYSYHRPYRNTEDMGKLVNNFAHIARKMHVIYALEGVSSNKEVTIKQLSGIENFKPLRDAKEMNLFFHESTQLGYLSKIAGTVSVFRVTVPWDVERLDEVYSAIIQHQQNLMEE